MSNLLEKCLTDAGICMLGLIAGTLSTAILYCHKHTRSEPTLGWETFINCHSNLDWNHGFRDRLKFYYGRVNPKVAKKLPFPSLSDH